MKILIRHRVLRRLICVCTVCLCPKNGMLGLYGLQCYDMSFELIFSTKPKWQDVINFPKHWNRWLPIKTTYIWKWCSCGVAIIACQNGCLVVGWRENWCIIICVNHSHSDAFTIRSSSCWIVLSNCDLESESLFWVLFYVSLRLLYLNHVMRKPVFAICEQQRHRSACTSRQSG